MLEQEKLLPASKLIPVRFTYWSSKAVYLTLFSDLVQQGISEKVALVINFLGAFFCGFILAYIRSWRLALALSAMLPCIGITGAIMNQFISKYMQ